MPPHTVSPVRTYPIDALLALGFTKTAIRHYIKKGNLPGAHGRGPSAHYTDVHLSILTEIKRAKDANRSLADLKDMAHERYKRAFVQ